MSMRMYAVDGLPLDPAVHAENMRRLAEACEDDELMLTAKMLAAALARVARLEAALRAERKRLMDDGHSWSCAKSDDRWQCCTCGLYDAVAQIDDALEVEP